ncbi:MAG: aldolase [Candidatus Woesearchaeota archaeon]
MKVQIPADVPRDKEKTYLANYKLATKNTGKLMLFAGDQRVEHLNDDFYGEGISPEDATPKHLFDIASKAKIGLFATQFGLMNRYAREYPKIPYLVKLNSKTHLVKTDQIDPVSRAWFSVTQVVDSARKAGITVVAVGYTVYLGSEFENDMLIEAAQIVHEAHKHGLLAVIWMYPRGKAIVDELDPHLIAGAADVASALGADFIKVNYPRSFGQSQALAFKEAILAAGNSGVICAGGSSTDAREFLQVLHDQIHISGARGNATGRNVHQKSLKEAVAFCNAIYAIVVEGKSVDQAYKLMEK